MMYYRIIYILLLLTLFSCSKDTDDLYEREMIEKLDEPHNNNGSSNNENKKDSLNSSDNSGKGNTLLLVNFLGDSIIDYWNDVNDYFPSLNCINYGITKKGIKTFLNNVDVKKLYNSVCVIEIGTNDMKNVILADTIDNYVKLYVDVLESLQANKIYLYSLLPRNRAIDKFDYNTYYPTVNSKIKEAVNKRMNNVIYIDIYDLFLKGKEINWEYTYDGLHPNEKGYEVMANELKKHI